MWSCFTVIISHPVMRSICCLAAAVSVLCAPGCAAVIGTAPHGEIGAFYLTVDSWKGMTYHVNVRGTEVLYRCSLYNDDVLTRWVAFSIPRERAQAFFADLEAVGVLNWSESYFEPYMDGEGWMMVADLKGRHVRVTGSNAQPTEFPALVDLVSLLLGDYPFGFSGVVPDSEGERSCLIRSVPLRNHIWNASRRDGTK
jgi:hypothetical protein